MACLLLLKTVSNVLFIPKATIYKLQKNEPIVARKEKKKRLKDEQWYLQTKLIKSNNKPMSLLKPAEI